MLKNKNYKLFIVEQAWDNISKVNIIDDPRNLSLCDREKAIPQLVIASEKYYECDETKWRSKVSKIDFTEI